MSSLNEHEEPEFPFEFERKFFVRDLPDEVIKHGSPTIIVQAYVFAEAGYAVRIRLVFDGVHVQMPRFVEATDYMGAYERKVLQELFSKIQPSDDDSLAEPGEPSVRALIAVKSPPVSGERYELETELDPDVAMQIIYRSERLVLKTRYSLWYGEDGWEFDVFEGQNRGLIVAECERIGPVVDLKIPEFCTTELTGDLRFTNDYLSKEPWGQWEAEYRAELAARGPFFLKLDS